MGAGWTGEERLEWGKALRPEAAKACKDRAQGQPVSSGARNVRWENGLISLSQQLASLGAWDACKVVLISEGLVGLHCSGHSEELLRAPGVSGGSWGGGGKESAKGWGVAGARQASCRPQQWELQKTGKRSREKPG